MAITLQEAKEYLRVGYDDDNDYITELIDISEAYIDGCVGTAYREKDKYNSEEEYKRANPMNPTCQTVVFALILHRNAEQQ